ncbi:hypothetical protein GPJ56_009034 [Histomonas meleagridis]|uniref:uncharacterized protein n=1 Tax=Histomonas meleagridis TaxID=135588 RepID=UPI003559E8F4|nr:hypothetical protein GPJ56_009034 [Histomonas meleagridis]KAH0799311.1 hypothetical protein GO595_008108 [Histomonas meleagridis]
MDLMIGDDPKLSQYVVNVDDYNILEKLRSGGFGIVDKVQEKKTGKIYAAKNINAKGKKLADTQMIKQEIEVFLKVKGPWIVPFHGISLTNFSGENYPTIFTDFMCNGSLGELLRRERTTHDERWDNTSKLIIIYGIAKAMSLLHHNQIIHKDLKPDNILLDEKLYPYISDFGMSSFFDSEIKSPNGGTPVFMAPEIYKNDPYDSKVDVYAFSMLCYQILVGKEPFQEIKNNVFVLWHRIIGGARPPIPDSIPKEISNIITKGWSKDPKARPTFDEIIDEIESGKVTLDGVDTLRFEEYRESIKSN